MSKKQPAPGEVPKWQHQTKFRQTIIRKNPRQKTWGMEDEGKPVIGKSELTTLGSPEKVGVRVRPGLGLLEVCPVRARPHCQTARQNSTPAQREGRQKEVEPPS